MLNQQLTDVDSPPSYRLLKLWTELSREKLPEEGNDRIPNNSLADVGGENISL